MPLSVTPSRLTSFGVGVLLLLNLVCVLIAQSLPALLGEWQQTETGLVYQRDQQSWVIQAMALPAPVLLNTALPDSAGHDAIDWYPLERNDLVEEPDFLTWFDDYNRLFERQSEISQMLQQPQVLLLTDRGEVLIEAVASRHWSDLPGAFWLQLVVADIAMLVALLLWIFRRGDPAVSQYCMLGLALLVVILPAALYSTRPLAMDGGFFHVLSVLDHFGLFLFAAAILSLVWLFPTPLSQRPFVRWSYLTMMLIWLLNSLQWVPSFNWTVRLVPILLVFITLVLIVFHWRRTAGQPANRMAVTWFLLTMVVGASSFVMVIFLPPMLGYEPLMSQSIAFTLFLSIYISLAVGVARYRLFDLGRWWFEAGLWLLSGAIIVVLDIAILALLDVTYQQATWIALAAAGWMYFPVRQFLIHHILRKYRLSLDATLPDLVAAVSGTSSQSEILGNIQQCFQSVFSPLEKRLLETQHPDVCIAEEGLKLYIPLPQQHGTLELTHADSGKRLFNSSDVSITRSMMHLFEQALESSDARQEGRRLERERIRQDMHDSLGGYLLAIIQQSRDSRIRQMGRYAWSELRDILSSLDTGPTLLSQSVVNWRTILNRLVAEDDVELRFDIDDVLYQTEQQLNGLQRLNIGQMLREGLVNAVRHSQAQAVDIRIQLDGNDLMACLEHDGVDQPPERWRKGRGMNHLVQRAEQLQGSIEWRSLTDDRVALRIRVPL